MSEKKTNGDIRQRLWTFFVYPESAPNNWRDKLDELHIKWVESPLHDKDLEADGEVKKEHWHILVMFDGKKSFSQIKDITDMLNQPIPQPCANAKGLVRYMAHLDNPDKYQYSPSDIIAHGGADIAELLKPSSSARYVLIREMVEYIQSQSITEFSSLVEYAMVERFDDWFPLLCDNSAYIIGLVIKSYRHGSSDSESRRPAPRPVDNTP